nr:MAG TPA: hypothetical protein [Caudoviricetes sp.]
MVCSGSPRDDKYIITFEDGAKMEAFPFADKED